MKVGQSVLQQIKTENKDIHKYQAKLNKSQRWKREKEDVRINWKDDLFSKKLMHINDH